MAQMNTLTVNGKTYEVVDRTARANAATAQSTIDTHGANKSNPHGVTYSQVGAAPAGHGYGGTLPTIVTELDSDGTVWEALADTFLATMQDGTVKQALIEDYPIISDGTMRFGSVYRHNANYVCVYAQGYNSSMMRKIKSAGTWQPWEYINPPMALGVEYRTTERWNGSVVYTRLVNFGTLPNNTTKTIDCGLASCTVISIEGIAYNSSGVRYPFPYVTSEGIRAYAYISSSATLGVRSLADVSWYSAYFIVKYTK